MEPLRFLQIEPTTRCNFTCGFCYGRTAPQADLDFATFERSLAAFPSVRHVELQGEGESLMHPRFLDMVDAARARGVKVSFITNGSFLTPEAIGRLLDAGVEKVSVSIESPDAAEFQAIRGGKLDKVLRGIVALLDERRRRGLDRPVVGFSVTVLKRTRHQLAAIVALYRRLGLDGGLTLQPLQRMPHYEACYTPSMQAEALSDEEVDEVWIRFLANRDIQALQKARPPVDGFYDELMSGWGPSRRRCPWLDGGMYVHNDGHATPCCMVKDTARHAYGRIGVDAPDAIDAARLRLRDELARGHVPAACSGCELASAATMSKLRMLQLGMRGLWHRWFGRLDDAAR